LCSLRSPLTLPYSIGSNGGFYSMFSRSMNCRVMAVDAQPWCLTRLSSAAALNGYTENFDVTWAAVSDDPNLEIEVGVDRCSGLWSVDEEETEYVRERIEHAPAERRVLLPQFWFLHKRIEHAPAERRSAAAATLGPALACAIWKTRCCCCSPGPCARLAPAGR
jgi:hypothetical protein